MATLVMVVTGALPVAAQDLQWESKITYQPDLEAGVLHVTAEMTFTNLKPNTTSGNVVTQYYYESVEFYVPATIDNATASSGDKSLDVTLSEEMTDEFGEVKIVYIPFGRRLFYKQAMTVTLDYDIPGDPPRSETVFRINPAYMSFAVSGWGDPGLVTVRVIVPNAFDITFDQPYSQRNTGVDEDVYTFSRIEDPTEFFVYVQARDDDKLTKDDAELTDYDIVIRSWPDDLAWNQDVGEAVAAGLPELQQLVGLPWRPVDTLRIVESQQVNLAGYGGWYLEDNETIEIGEWVDPHLVLHELSHTWFNGDLFTGRWINEGLADEFAAEAVENTGLTVDYELRQDRAPRRYAGAVALNDWEVPAIGQDDIERYENYGYDASYWVVQEIAAEIGPEAMASVLAAAANDEIAYLGEPVPEKVDESDDWRRFLDLLQERGGSTVAEDLFSTFVTDFDLTARAAARDSYEELVSSGGDWAPPFYVRTSLGDWDFAQAEDRIDEAMNILDTRAVIEEASVALSVEAPASLESAYEAATDSLDAVVDLAADQVETVEIVVDAQEAVDAERDFWENVGLIGQDPDQELSQAIDAFEADSLTTATMEAEQVIGIIEDAGRQGRNRVLALGGFMVVVAGGTILLIRRRHVTPATEGPAAMSEVSEDASAETGLEG